MENGLGNDGLLNDVDKISNAQDYENLNLFRNECFDVGIVRL